MRIIDCEQGSPEWIHARRGVPSASNFAKLITPGGKLSTQAHGYAYELLADLADPNFGEYDDYVSAAMKNGNIIEPEARSYYAFARGADVEQVGFCMDDAGRFGASPDGLVGDDGGLEIKSPLHKTHIGYLIDGVVPPKYLPQVHGCMVVTGRNRWDFMSFAPGLPELLVTVRQDAYTDKLRHAMDEFWKIYTQTRAKLEALGWTPYTPAAPVEDVVVF